jgi:putative DNA primase/helicase
LVVPDAVKRATDSYFEEQDTMGQWLTEVCERHPSAVTPSAELFASWALFAHQAGETTMTRKAFSMELARRGFELSRAEFTRNIIGLRLKKAGSRAPFAVV